MIYIVPLESYEERYSAQWSRWIPKSLKRLKIPFKLIEGEPLTQRIEHGQVLDTFNTNYFKLSQLQELIIRMRGGEIKDGDVIWFADLWFPGIESLAYIRAMTGVKFKIEGVLHAGTWDKHDFTYLSGMGKWGKHIEQGWMGIFDTVYLGSLFHARLINSYLIGAGSKLKVTGLFFDYKEVQRKNKKKNIVVFPHRLDQEKRPDLFDKLSDQFKSWDDWKFLKSKDVTRNKDEYYNLLSESKIAISFAEQETFGYAMLEAIANKCIPLVPNSLSYKTMDIYSGHRFEDYDDAVYMVSQMITFLDNEHIEFSDDRFFPELDKFLPDNIIKKMFVK